MVQKDRSIDHKEAFDESGSEISDLYVSDSDEEWNEFKRKATTALQQRSQKQNIIAQDKKKPAKNKHTVNRIERSSFVTKSLAIPEISAHDGPKDNELELRK